jgi:predicted aspartyl protease
MKNLLLAWFASLLMSTPGLAVTPVTSTPLSRTEIGHFVIEVMINEQGPFTVAVDTAAQRTALNQILVDALSLEPIEGMSARAQGASGTASIEFYELDSLDVSGVVYSEFVAMGPVAGHSPDFGDTVIHGVLGFDFLQQFNIEFSQSEGVFRLYPHGHDFSEITAGWSHADIRPGIAGFMMTDVTINGVSIPAVLDTGASRSLINWNAAQAAGYVADDERVTPDIRPIRGFTGAETESRRVTDAQVVWGDARLGEQTISISDLSVFNALRMAEGPAMIAGNPLFGDRDFIVDYSANRLLIAPETP